MNKLFAAILILLLTYTAYSQNIEGDWKGTLNFQGKSIDFAYHILRAQDQLTATMDIPSQGLNGGKAASTTFVNDTISITFPSFGIVYKGMLQEDVITGNIIQNNFPVALNLVRGVLTINRPQQPKAPFTYTSQEVSFTNKTDGVTLDGTLTLPKDIKNPPIVLIISGSGPQNRDGDMFGHQLYYVLADHLSSNGIGVLRYDERGVGTSTGTFETAGIEAFSRDATAAIVFLKSTKNIKKSKLGVIGHSIGGIIAPQMAATNADIDFTIMLAGPGVNGDQLMLSQKAAMERLMGVTEAQIKQGQELLGSVYTSIIQSNGDNEAIKKEVQEALSEKLGPLVPAQQVRSITNQITSAEIISLLKSTPATYLSVIKTPVLAINGTYDFQVPHKANLEAIQAAFEKGANTKTKTVALETLNHLFQESTTGALSEYAEIEQTMSPKALDLIIRWIKEQTKP